MFDRIFRRAERKIDSVVSKYVRRAIVAVPLLIASLFATAAISVKVVEVYGPVNGYAMMAGGFAALAAVIALFALTGQRNPRRTGRSRRCKRRRAGQARRRKPACSTRAVVHHHGSGARRLARRRAHGGTKPADARGARHHRLSLLSLCQQ